MKILRMFDSFKFVRAIFVAVVCAFFIFPAKSDDCVVTKIFQGEQYTEENKTAETIMRSNGSFDSNTNYYVTDYIPLKAGDYRFTIKGSTGNRPVRLFLYNENHDIIAKPVDEDTTSTTNLQTFNFNVPTNCYARISARNTTTEKSLQPVNPITYTEPCIIKIATTRYNEREFAPVQSQLDAAVAAVDTVVSQTMDQAQQIDDIANNKQTRPDETCPVGKNCLLVEEEDGTPHWYVIAGADEATPTTNP